MQQGFGNLYPSHYPPSPIGNVDISQRTFGKILQELLEQRDISMSSFAAEIGMSTAQVSRIIADTRTPAHEFSKKMSLALGLSGSDAHWFGELVNLAHVDKEIWKNYFSMKVQIYRRELKITELLKRLAHGSDNK